MATNMHTPTLLTLPLELRNIIYSELLSSRPYGVEYLILYDNNKHHHAPCNLYPSILRTNKQIYAEAISYLYNDNIFRLDLDYLSTKRPIVPLFRCNDALQQVLQWV